MTVSSQIKGRPRSGYRGFPASAAHGQQGLHSYRLFFKVRRSALTKGLQVAQFPAQCRQLGCLRTLEQSPVGLCSGPADLPTCNSIKFIADGFQGLLARGLPGRVDHVDIDKEARQTGLEPLD